MHIGYALVSALDQNLAPKTFPQKIFMLTTLTNIRTGSGDFVRRIPLY